MKTSISVPDDLWDCVKTAGDGPSAVVQQGLTLLCEKLSDPLGHAPSGVSDQTREAVVERSARAYGQVRAVSQRGYELGVDLAAYLDFAELVSLPTNQHTLARALGEPLEGEFYLDVSLVERTSLYSWELADLSENFSITSDDFWDHLDAALLAHALSAGQSIMQDDADGVPKWTLFIADRKFELDVAQLPEGAELGEPDPSIGRALATHPGIPYPFLFGLAGALLDVRAPSAEFLEPPSLAAVPRPRLSPSKPTDAHEETGK